MHIIKGMINPDGSINKKVTNENEFLKDFIDNVQAFVETAQEEYHSLSIHPDDQSFYDFLIQKINEMKDYNANSLR